MSSAKKTVKIHPYLADRVDEILKSEGFSSRAGFVEDSVRRRLEELASVKPDGLTKEEKESLLLAAEDYYHQHKNFEEAGVRDFLEGRYYYWPKGKLELGVIFVCTQKIN